MFSATDFPTTELVDRKAITYVINNVYYFQERYDASLVRMFFTKSPLRVVDNSLFMEIYDCLISYYGEKDNEKLFNSVEEIFG